MQTYRIIVSAAATITLSFAAGAAPLMAQANVRTACWSDIQRLCATELAARNREGIRTCMRTNLRQLSPECRSAVMAARAAQRPDRPPPARPDGE